MQGFALLLTLFTFGVAAALFLVGCLIKPKKAQSAGRYTLVPQLLTRNEQEWRSRLAACLPQGCLLMAKVRLIDVITPENSGDRAMKNKVIAKHLDFLLVRELDMAPLLAIEVDDRSHLRRDRQIRDAFVDEALRQAGLPILRVTRPNPQQDVGEVMRQAIQKAA